MSTYIASYFYYLGKDVTMEQFYVVQPIIVVTATFLFPVGMYLSNKFNAKLVLLVTGIFTFSCIWMCSYLTSPTVFIYCYSIAFGVGKGLMYSTALQAAISHLPGRKGIVSGFVICGFGFGGFFFGMITKSICNPDDIRPELM